MKPLILFGLVAAVFGSRTPSFAARPNFVVIFSDDHTYRAIGYNNPAVQTPNLDRLAAEGIRLDRAFVASPICVASRASIYSGVYPQRHGAVGLSNAAFTQSVMVEKRFATLPAALGQAGYHTALYGKSHLGEPVAFGFAEGREIRDPNDFETFAEAEKFLQRESKSGRPFLLWLTPHNPHVPLSAPQRFKDLYKDTTITLDPNWRESPLMQSFFNQAAAGQIVFRDGPLPIYPNAPAGQTSGPPRSAANMKEVIKAYYADVSCLDEQVGRLVEQLKAAGLYENTYLVYLSDNGYHLGNHGLGNKITMHEESVRVPMFIHSPLLTVKRARSDALVSSLDVYPTLLDLADVPAPAHLMGRSLRPILAVPSAIVRDYVVSEGVGPPERRVGTGHRMVRTDHFKYILSSSDEEAFFDLRSDAHELKNLIGRPELAGEIARHRLMLREWMTAVGEKRMPPVASDEPPPEKAKKNRKAR
ncbi:MAG: sulfatase [Opitutus sp.]|nr:sulfatase [Opitutus sp.]